MVFGKENALECLSKAPIAFIGTMKDVIRGPSTRSLPPIDHYKLRFKDIRSLRGSISLNEFDYHEQGTSDLYVNASRNRSERTNARQNKTPAIGLIYLACLNDEKHVHTLVELDNNTIEQLLQSSRMPIGWTRRSNGEYESPWQYSHAKRVRWYDNQCFSSSEKCSKSGRPLLSTNDNITFICEPIKAAQTKEFQNPDGDGVFQLTVSNNSGRSVQVPALLRDPRSRAILWEESVFVITDAGNHFFPGHGQARDAESIELQPNEKVSTKLDTLTLRGLSWPQGGWRLNLRFCLGNKAAEGSYYYYTDHHDPIRNKAEEKRTAIID